MTDDNAKPSSNDKPDQPKPEPVAQQAQQSQTSPVTQPAGPGRKPLFRN